MMPRPGPPEIAKDVDKLLGLVGQYGKPAGDPARARLSGLARAICHWNEAINLVSRKDIGRLISYHFCDSASVLPIVGWRAGLRVLDVGGSNGLPGLVLAALLPDIKLTICDARLKRRVFLEDVCREAVEGEPRQATGEGQIRLSYNGPRARSAESRGEVLIDNAGFEIGRTDSEAFQARHRAGFDLIVARAVTHMKLLVRWCMPLLGRGGTLVAYKGSRCAGEVSGAEGDIFRHGGRMAAVVASPWADRCNPLRIFGIVVMG